MNGDGAVPRSFRTNHPPTHTPTTVLSAASPPAAGRLGHVVARCARRISSLTLAERAGMTAGFMDAEELSKAMNKLGLDMTLARAQHIMRALDVSGDGRVEYEEFLAAFRPARTTFQVRPQLACCWPCTALWSLLDIVERMSFASTGLRSAPLTARYFSLCSTISTRRWSRPRRPQTSSWCWWTPKRSTSTPRSCRSSSRSTRSPLPPRLKCM